MISIIFLILYYYNVFRDILYYIFWIIFGIKIAKSIYMLILCAGSMSIYIGLKYNLFMVNKNVNIDELKSKMEEATRGFKVYTVLSLITIILSYINNLIFFVISEYVFVVPYTLAVILLGKVSKLIINEK